MRQFTIWQPALKQGESAKELEFLALFEGVADELALDDPRQFVTLVEAILDVPLQTAKARQKVAYYYAIALRRDSQFQAAVNAFADLLAEPDLAPGIYGRALNSQAIAYRLLGEPEQAIANYQKSLTLWQQLADAENLGKVHLNMGIMSYELRAYKAAEGHLRQSLEYLVPQNLPKLIAIAQNELGLVYRDRGQWTQALEYFNLFIEQRQEDGAQDNVAIGLLNIGEIKLYQGELAEAERSLKQALAIMQAPEYRIDMLLHLGLAHQARGDLEQAKITFTEALALAVDIERREFLPHVYYHLGDVRRLLGDRTGALREWETAVALIEDTREPIEDEAIRISLLGRWQQIYEALLLHSLGEGNVAAAFMWAERARARAFAEGLVGELETVATLADVQAALTDDTAVICYFTTGVLVWDLPMLQTIPKDNPLREHVLLPPKIILFVITKQETAVHICPLDPNKFATASPRGQDITRYLQPPVSAKLFAALLKPAAETLSANHLVLIPHGPLHHVPFTAVIDHWQPHPPELTLSPSATVWWQQQNQPAAAVSGTALVLGYPGSDLQFAEAEAAAVATILKSEVKIGEFDKQWLQKTAVNRRLLHFACHAQFMDEDPLNAYLELGLETRLTAKEVLADWQLNCELVVLSACQTGVSHILRGDEPMGLIRAFLSAGAQAVLVTQWPVEDLPTFLLMTHFYQQLTTDAPGDVSRALRQAQAWLRQLSVAEIRQILDQWQSSKWPTMAARSCRHCENICRSTALGGVYSCWPVGGSMVMSNSGSWLMGMSVKTAVPQSSVLASLT